MNTRTSLIATAATLALFSAAKGQTVIDITGSTAGRSTINTTLGTLLTGESVAWYTTDGRTVTSAASADGAIYKGGTLLVNSVATPVTVRTFWAGSATGVDYVSNQVQLNNKFLATSVTAAGAQLTGVDIVLAPASAETVAEFGFSDVKQAATVYQTNALAEQTDMYVLPFRWLRTADLSGVSNITSQQVRAHYTGLGEVPKSLYTANAADTASVYAVGRDGDSGTRITAFAETGAGAFATVAQWGFTTSGSGASVTISDPAELGNGGYASGGSVATILGGAGLNAVGYVGVSDATTAIGNGAVALNYNGVEFTNANVMNGTYTFWCKYQAIRKQTLSGASASLFSSLKTTLVGLASGSSSIKLTDMKVTRVSDGSDVLPN
jgi:hypothetical protein